MVLANGPPLGGPGQVRLDGIRAGQSAEQARVVRGDFDAADGTSRVHRFAKAPPTRQPNSD